MGFTHPTYLIGFAARKARRGYTLRLLLANDDGFHPSYMLITGWGGRIAVLNCAPWARCATPLPSTGGNLGQAGSVAFLFKRAGVLSYPSGLGEDRVTEAALEAGAEDVATDSHGAIEVLTAPEDFATVVETMIKLSLRPEHAEIQQRASTPVPVSGEDAEKLFQLLEALEELDDVQNVYSNADFPEEFLKQAC